MTTATARIETATTNEANVSDRTTTYFLIVNEELAGVFDDVIDAIEARDAANAAATQTTQEIKAALITLYENLIMQAFEEVQATVANGGAIDFTQVTALQNTLAEIKARKV